MQESVMHHTVRSRYALIPLWHISQQELFYLRSIAWQGTASMLKLFPGFFVFLQKCFLFFCFLSLVQENQFSFKFCRRSQMREYFALWLSNNKFPWYNPQSVVLYLNSEVLEKLLLFPQLISLPFPMLHDCHTFAQTRENLGASKLGVWKT